MAQSIRSRLWRTGYFTVAMSFLLAFVAFGGGDYTQPDNINGSVYQWSADNPGAEVPVIVQTTGDTSDVASAVASLGGEVLRELSLTASVQALVPATQLSQIAGAEGVAYVTLDAPFMAADHNSDSGSGGSTPTSTYPASIGASVSWAQGFRGDAVTVAVVDTGISPRGHEDFKRWGNSRVIAETETNSQSSNVTDPYGHGTHVAGIIGGDGDKSNGKFVGVAPRVNMVNVRIGNDSAGGTLGDLMAGLEWVANNQQHYNIRVVNLSLHSSVAESYRTSPINAAVEALWFRGIFVVVAAGNTDGSVIYPPANDPFVFTVGSIDDKGTPAFGDDVVSSFSSRGVTQDGFAKPDAYAPGQGIISVAETNSSLYDRYKNTPNVIDVGGKYLRLSGTSMAAGAASGAAALAFQAHPTWTPGQVKCTIMSNTRPLADGTPVIDIGRVTAAATPSCDSDPAALRAAGVGGLAKIGVIAWILAQPDQEAAAASIGFPSPALVLGNGSNVTFSTIQWSAIQWSAIQWSSLQWSVIQWSSLQWSAIQWSAIQWSQIDDSGVNYDAIQWSAIQWSSLQWSALQWSALQWSALQWSALQWSSLQWTALQWSVVSDATSGQGY